MAIRAAFLIFSSACSSALAAGDAGSPIAKILQLLSDIQTKVITEGEAGQKAYAEYAGWCEDRSREIAFAQKTGKATIEELQASIGEKAAIISSRTARVEELAGSLSGTEADLKAATQVREKEAKDFAVEEKELAQSLDMLHRATAIIEREMKGGASMLQLKNADSVVKALKIMVQASLLNTADAAKLSAFVQQASSSDDAEAEDTVGAPDAEAYESHSDGILDTLEDLLDKVESQLDELREKETTSLQNFELLKQSLESELSVANKDMESAKKDIAEAGEAKSMAEGDLDVTTKDFKGGAEAKATLHHECMSKAEDFEAETKSRGEELKALAEAKQVIKESAGGAEDLSYGLNQVSLLQVNSGSTITTSAALAQFEATRFIRDLARKQSSPELAQLATRMDSVIRASNNAGEDPFAKVKKLIQDMVEKLEKNADCDATQKAFCDKELAESSEKKTDKTSEMEKLSTSIDKMSARSAQLKEETAALHKALAELASSTAVMNKLRGVEKAAFTTNKADMEQGLEGIKMALKILNEYYAKEDKAHSAGEGAGTSIIGLLEVVESDFTKGVAEMSGAEENAVSTYEEQTKENAIETATKNQDVKYKTKEAAQLDQNVAETTSDRAGVQAEMDAVLEYLKKIEEQCIAKAESYAERKARFEAELAGLKQALQILESETAFVQRSAKKQLRGLRAHHA
mmetsp:Transcript_97839/g.262918  ORF Transcript_97839/g.262918 Transcript_97839/m.262918 type:complete len:693 (+) Transcript_97839:77-2155(+)